MKTRPKQQTERGGRNRLPNPLAHMYRVGRKRDRARRHYYARLDRLRRQHERAARPGKPAYDAAELKAEAMRKSGAEARLL